MADKIKYVIATTVIGVNEEHRKVWVSGIGKETVFREHSLGWFVHLDGSDEAICLGAERPVLKVGDAIKITIEKA